MKMGLTGQWAENEYDTILEGGVKTSHSNFFGRLRDNFSDPNEEHNAQHQLSTMHQGFNESTQVFVFFQKFDLNRQATRYQRGQDSYLIELLSAT